MIGMTFGQYRIDREIGSGGMGTVYQGTHLNLNKRVAIKVLHSHLVKQRILVDRFQREALIQAKLTHPNIVTVNDFLSRTMFAVL